MDRRHRLAVLAATLAVGCAGRAAPSTARVIERGTLGYAVAFGDGALCTIELDLRFALVVRDPRSGAARARHDLGPAERDLPALAVVDGQAWVGGADRAVRAIGLATGAVEATWPIGAAVTALAATADGNLVIGDATGALCLRRRRDGALLQCVAVADQPIAALRVDGPTVVARAAGRAVRLTLPALVVGATTAAPPEIRGHEVVLDGVVVARFAGAARAVARGPDGAIAAVGWVRDLDDASVVLVAPPLH
ncbi:MAG: hypothetical protein IPH44_39835 [Myxococcales bacterium]|jgi:hypothetical protein|nr:hypothetical protein [Myxococcales bacterium]MBK7196978.1 hypothetical protein [Myxococcales bacterium]MBP6845208.1 hypothetical protein [Kofleriaceae bacterium]